MKDKEIVRLKAKVEKMQSAEEKLKAKVEKTKTVKSTTKADAKVVEDAATKTPPYTSYQ